MPEFTFSDATLDAIERILVDIFSDELKELEELQKLEELRNLEELHKINQALERITLILEKIGRTKGIDV